MYPPHSGDWCLVHCSLCTLWLCICCHSPSFPFPCFLHQLLLSTSSVPLSPSPSLLYMLSLLIASLSHPLSLWLTTSFMLTLLYICLSLSISLSSLASPSMSSFLFCLSLSLCLSSSLACYLSYYSISLSLSLPSHLAVDTSAFYLLLCLLFPFVLGWEMLFCFPVALFSSFPWLLQAAKPKEEP